MGFDQKYAPDRQYLDTRNGAPDWPVWRAALLEPGHLLEHLIKLEMDCRFPQLKSKNQFLSAFICVLNPATFYLGLASSN